MKKKLLLMFGLMVFLPAIALDTGAFGYQDTNVNLLSARLAEKVTVSDLISLACSQNPSIRAYTHEWEAIVEEYRVRTSYPDPQFSMTYFVDPIETRLGPQDWNLTISQVIPFPGKLSKTGEIYEKDARISRLKLDRAIRDIVTAILESYYELVYIQQAQRIAQKNEEILNLLLIESESAYAQNRSAFFDVSKARSQMGQLTYDILLLQELEQAEKTRLNGLLNRPADAPLGQFQQIPLSKIVYEPGELYQLAEMHQQEIKIAGLQVEKAAVNIDLSAYGNLPDFRLGIFYAGIGEPNVSVHPPDAGKDALGIQFGISIPIWFGKNKSRIAMARAEAEKAKAARSERINESRTQIRRLYFKLKNAERLVELYRDQLLPQAIRSMETSETWFRQGQGSFSDFVEAISTVHNFQLTMARARADYGKMQAAIERLTGRRVTVEKSQIVSGENEK